MVSVTGPTLWSLVDWDQLSQDYLKSLLFGEKVGGISEKASWKPVVKGVAEGRVVVSNLETLVLSFGTRFDPIMYGRGDLILGFEELDIDKSLLQRQVDIVLSHKRAKKLRGLS
jgi:muramoyltetrapeptide carboxypeptidase LdcA involved in peptidoglycan recycling